MVATRASRQVRASELGPGATHTTSQATSTAHPQLDNPSASSTFSSPPSSSSRSSRSSRRSLHRKQTPLDADTSSPHSLPPHPHLAQPQPHPLSKPGKLDLDDPDFNLNLDAQLKEELNKHYAPKQQPPHPSSPDMVSGRPIAPCEDAVFATPTGTVVVRPYVSAGKEIKALLQFTPRFSSFNRENTKSQSDEFRGFFTLFWIGLALLFLRTCIESWELNRTILSPNFAHLITADGVALAFADLIMVTSMLLCVPFVKCLQKGYFNYYYTGLIIQHLFQTTFLGIAIVWGYARNWYWVQAGFLVLHALSSMMKMHSYMSHNGMLATVHARLQKEKHTLHEYLNSLPGGHEGALAEAAEHKAELEAREASAPQVSEPATRTPTPPQITVTGEDGTVVSETIARLGQNGEVAKKNNEVRRRLRSTKPATDALPAPQSGLPRGTSLEPAHTTSPHAKRVPTLLAWSSDPKIALLARNIDEMSDELCSNGERGLVWPQNVTYKHFIEFMFFPTLVYQLEYPRTSTMRPLFVLEKVFATFGTFSLIYTVTEHYIMPYSPKPGDNLIQTFAQLAIPMIINFLLIFYIIFECVCTGFAELSYFADREFYQDWWNSTSWDEFSRKWNKPVHTFLLRHVYASSRHGLRLGRWGATFFTFLLSALCHELVMAVVSKKIRPYLFLMQMIQLPMIMISRLPAVKRNRTLGNIIFWAGLMLGFPLLEICYLRF
ncbi:MBOAT-domain-containing protein [Cutaneotrichosporon oleaginosum]|uniref:MBOAT-domain-containing protein n=1 Tax=Cutaneotrichosporon oleaginosum TaxID=879819 RepID=A0A0J0XES3_9TREE|nr:MBOAT-domain-containing protein [Cutaneotrichosporon oleaginosum]KLT39548.1 MBOAT-domain-containing protein [Cutaneotrichosporon oleaginosum]